MKKVLALVLAAALALSLVACGGNNDDVRDALQGTWVAQWTNQGYKLSRYYTFKDDSYTTGGTLISGDLDPKTGTFEVKSDTIHLIPDDGSSESDLDYTYNKSSGTITLWWNDDVQFEKGNVKVNY